jgi:hybrid cluster-associated redox disulfide protein
LWYYNNIPDKEVIKMAFEVTKDTIIGDIMDHDESVAPYFTDMGMHCLYCPASRGETLEEACEVHGVDPKEMIKKLNAHFAK